MMYMLQAPASCSRSQKRMTRIRGWEELGSLAAVDTVPFPKSIAQSSNPRIPASVCSRDKALEQRAECSNRSSRCFANAWLLAS